MSIERFIKDDDSNFIAIQAGVNSYELMNMSGEMKEHHISIRFLDSAGDDVFPTGGVVEFQSSQFRKPVYDSIEGGKFNAADLALDHLERPVNYGPMRAAKVVLSDIEGSAVSAIVKITSF